MIRPCLNDREEKNSSLARGSRWFIGAACFIFALMFLEMAREGEALFAEGGRLFSLGLALFFAMITGACLLPQRLAVWCGRLVAVFSLGFCGVILFLGMTDGGFDIRDSVLVFGFVGIPSLIYLFHGKFVPDLDTFQ